MSDFMMPRGELDVRENYVQGFRVFCGMDAQKEFWRYLNYSYEEFQDYANFSILDNIFCISADHEKKMKDKIKVFSAVRHEIMSFRDW